MKKKLILKMTLGDVKHWVGWGITTGVLVGVFALLPVSIMQSYVQIILVTLGVIVAVDVIKHYINLQ